MKNTFLIFILLSLNATALLAQKSESMETRFIAVTGSAEMSVQPDEVELEITLKGYGEKNNLMELSKVESRFFEILEKNNIPKGNVKFNNSRFYWYQWWSYRKSPYQQKSFILQLNESTDFLALMKDLDMEGVSKISIFNTSNKNLQDLRKEVKINAVKAAKEKAKYLLESIDEKLGGLISIEEVNPSSNYYWGARQDMVSNVQLSTVRSGEEMNDVTAIKLRYEVNAKFEIQRE